MTSSGPRLAGMRSTRAVDARGCGRGLSRYGLAGERSNPPHPGHRGKLISMQAALVGWAFTLSRPRPPLRDPSDTWPQCAKRRRFGIPMARSAEHLPTRDGAGQSIKSVCPKWSGASSRQPAILPRRGTGGI
jgi:hypothetical protein